MNKTFLTEKPCTVDTGRGFSVLYKDKLLYSKYNPSETIKKTIQSVSILPNTLVLCFSPCIFYGAKELLEKLDENCLVVFCEKDKPLYDFAIEQKENQNLQSNKNILFIEPDNIVNFPLFLNNILQNTQENNFPIIKRVFRIDFSGGIQFYKEVYDKVFEECQLVVSQFWKNRITLVKLGRLYSRNLFNNLARYATKNAKDLLELKNTVKKAIVICGTGESLEKTVELLKNKELRQKVYVLALDASLPVLASHSVKADGVVGVESQLAIEKNYIGTINYPFTFFSDITSRVHVSDIVKNKICYFSSEYDSNAFFAKLKKDVILPCVIKPLGSVGLVAVQVALILRQSSSIPIFITGLDFSYTLGKTHANGSASNINALITSNRITGLRLALTEQSKFIKDKNDKKMFTTFALENYANVFKTVFSNCKNLFDIGDSGIELQIKRFPNWTEYLQKSSDFYENVDIDTTCTAYKTYGDEKTKAIKEFFNTEKKALEELRELLQNGNSTLSKSDLELKIENIIKFRNYLYLHFPDGERYSNSISFLKRVRSEIDFFIKDMDLCLAKLD